jgi:hypothetical protein
MRLIGIVVAAIALAVGGSSLAAARGLQYPPPRRAAPQPQRAPTGSEGLTPEESKKFAQAMKRLTPEQRQRIAAAVQRLNPEQRRQLVQELKRDLAGKRTASQRIKRTR